MLIDEAWSQLAQDHDISLDTPVDAVGDLALRVPGWPAPVSFVVQVLARAPTPGRLEHLVERHREQFDHGTRLLLVTPSATSRLMQAAAEAGVSVLVAPADLGVPVHGVLMAPDGTPHPVAPPAPTVLVTRLRPGRIPWGTYAIAIDLLTTGQRQASQRQIAARVGLTQARVSQALRDLRPVVSTHRAGVSFEREALAAWLAGNYPRRPRMATSWSTLDPPVRSAAAVHDLLEARGVTHAVSGQVAADQLAPWERPAAALVWVAALADLTAAEATPVGPGEATLTLAVPQDPYLLQTIRKVDGRPPTVAPWRVWLDLMHDSHDEAAAVLHQALVTERVR